MLYKLYLLTLIAAFGILVGVILSEEVPDRRNTRSIHTTVLHASGGDGIPIVRVRYVHQQPL